MPTAKYLPHYTVADYRQWDGDWELWDGIPVAMTPSPFYSHQRVLFNLAVQVGQALKASGTEHCVAVVELDWRVDASTVVRPDLAVSCPPPTGDFLESAPRLVAEILSPSTRDRDRNEKSELYRAAGVENYLLIDPIERALELRVRAAGAYQSAPDPTRVLITDSVEIRLNPAELWR